MRWAGLTRLRFGVLGCCLAAVVLAGCGSTTTNNSAVTVDGRTLTIYASEPPGAQTTVDADVLDAERLALHQAGSKSGKYALRLLPLHGATVSDNARTAVQNSSAIAYLVGRLGFYYRASRHRRVPRAMIDEFFAAEQPKLTALVPSYQEEPGVILMTLLSIALQVYVYPAAP